MKQILTLTLVFMTTLSLCQCRQSTDKKITEAIYLKQDQAQLVEIEDVSVTTTCENNQDCVLVRKGCCPCEMGGQRQAIPKSVSKDYLDSWNKNCSDKLFCMAVISPHKSCLKETTATCKDSSCQLSYSKK